ncbi:MAG: alpha/beta hydrolase [Dongiaceae bacterium]
MIVFLHGILETAVIWNNVRSLIGRDSVALSMPGFGCPRPADFGATKDDYVRWLVGELDRIGGPIDLVGHDWGALLTYRVATKFGDRLRSWCADVGNVLHPDYEWHAFAKTWQTKGDGEAYFAKELAASPQERAQRFAQYGLQPAQALELATGLDDVMAGCTLDLYRSAMPNPHRHWGPLTPTSAPGLVLHGTDDPFSHEEMASEVAHSLGAGFKPLRKAGHFWPYQTPAEAAATLTSFWATLS